MVHDSVTAERFWPKIDKENGPVHPTLGRCWMWTACLTKSGYGQMNVHQRKRNAYTVAFELVVGEVPAGLELDHLCRNRRCVNPSHLEPVTHAENMRRGAHPDNQFANATHCLRGHLFDEQNTFHHGGRRHCRLCRREWRRRQRSQAAGATL